MSPKKGCRCDGHWAHKKTHFVVTRRCKATAFDGSEVDSKHSEVKCMQCLRKWRSTARYVADLRDHDERTYGTLTDDDILQLVSEGRITVDFFRGDVWKQQRRHGKWRREWKKLTPRTNRDDRWESDRSRGEPYLFVTIHFQARRKEIAITRLVWMAFHGRVVPEGHDIDHVDRNHANNALGNLRLLEAAVNRSDTGFGERDFGDEF